MQCLRLFATSVVAVGDKQPGMAERARQYHSPFVHYTIVRYRMLPSPESVRPVSGAVQVPAASQCPFVGLGSRVGLGSMRWLLFSVLAVNSRQPPTNNQPVAHRSRPCKHYFAFRRARTASRPPASVAEVAAAFPQQRLSQLQCAVAAS
uniref:Secreted protein n=1 Tax=Steinernema glaseri TaxID=37863 RepID=A0A1I7YGI5_9BILA